MWQALGLAMVMSGTPADAPMAVVKEGVALRGILGLDAQTAIVWGYIVGEGCPAESLLLRTTDSGAHWETSFPGDPSYVVGPVTAVGSTLWAVNSFSCEGSGESVLYRSVDAGAHWKKLAQLASGARAGVEDTVVLSMHFSSEKDGVVELKTMGEHADQVSRLESHDGGEHWKVVSKHPAGKAASEPDAEQSTAPDGTRWTLKLGGYGGYKVTATAPKKQPVFGNLPDHVSGTARTWKVNR
jgi:hypothetical protein